MRMPTRLFAFGTLLPAAAAGGMSRIDSMRPVPARSGCGAAGATTMAPGAAGGTTTAPAVGAGCTTTGAGAGATLCSVAQPASTAATESVKAILVMAISFCRPPPKSNRRSQVFCRNAE